MRLPRPDPDTFLDFNEQFQQAFDLMEQSAKNVFVTGRAGTGKSTLLKYFREHTRKNIVVLAPTGVAAVNISGQTIHSFFRFKPDITLGKIKKITFSSLKENIYRQLDAIVIDEISMVRADLLDCVDRFLRLNGKEKYRPFGGIQLIFIGDLYQLPPVTTDAEKTIFSEHYTSPYFFSAHVLAPPQHQLLPAGEPFAMEMIELEKIYRQRDEQFIALLNSIRNNTAGVAEFALLQTRQLPNFHPGRDDFFIHLTTTNAMAKALNDERLHFLKTKLWTFVGQRRGDFDDKYLPTDSVLTLKPGAQVMMLNNDSRGRWINGTIGQLLAVREKNPEDNSLSEDEVGATVSAPPASEEAVLVVELENGNTVEVSRYRWDIYEFSYDQKTRRIESDSVGSFTQYPLKLAWAVTIHKSQGKTFEKVIVDIGRGTFSPGQLYVALSRATTLEGLVLKQPVKKQHIWLDRRVVQFVTTFQYQKSAAALSTADKMKFIAEAINNKHKLAITYLKAQDIKSRRVIIPEVIGEMEYAGKKFLGVQAFCLERQDTRVFRVDRILEIRVAEETTVQ